MEIYVGMSRKSLRAFAEEILAACDANPLGEGIEVTRYIEHNDPRGGELVLVFNNDDMERPEVQDRAIWEET